ncbi:MAG TPA: hypothetical protein VFV71_04845 [Burkholderiales bacterium]|nr:hypothetical protein [Burkholderiales bacterium]
MIPSPIRKLVVAAILILPPAPCPADDDDAEIVTSCNVSNAEFGVDMIHICIRDNFEARAELQRYPAEYRHLIGNCGRRKQMWDIVKRCVDDDIAVMPVLRAYSVDHADELRRCGDELPDATLVGIKACVDKLVQAHKADDGKQ